MYNLVQELDFDDDIKQEFFVKILEEEQVVFDNASHMKGYVIQRLHNLQSNAHRVESRRKEIEYEAQDDIVRTLGLNTSAADPQAILQAMEELEERVSGLSWLLQGTLTDYYVNGMTPEEIATRDGENVEAVRKRLTRGRNELKGWVS